jgi:hypothetical protein
MWALNFVVLITLYLQQITAISRLIPAKKSYIKICSLFVTASEQHPQQSEKYSAAQQKMPCFIIKYITIYLIKGNSRSVDIRMINAG